MICPWGTNNGAKGVLEDRRQTDGESSSGWGEWQKLSKRENLELDGAP